ncbi:hypothetical protein [Halomicronema sp. CCY15110]|uniref:hypothetical protein n=1 Tax=Halomicronema sp. CCY15110 TaxID=2767773 RepID=UPI001951AE0C|nr:hypothetical protein [Halomicronema sp. CCY15110]
MKRMFWTPLLRYGLWLGTLLSPLTAQATPAPLFDAILPDIQQQLPGDLQMRLPSYLPALSEPLYPSIDVGDTGLMVYLSPDPDCDRGVQPDCLTVGAAAIMHPAAFADWQQRHQDDLTPVELSNSITGRYLTIDYGEGEIRYVAWQQEQTGYVLGAIADGISQDELMRVANSMIESDPLE